MCCLRSMPGSATSWSCDSSRGLNIPETADALGVSTATVEREWAMAKAWLHQRLSARN
jgi:ECF sigma factor